MNEVSGDWEDADDDAVQLCFWRVECSHGVDVVLSDYDWEPMRCPLCRLRMDYDSCKTLAQGDE